MSDWRYKKITRDNAEKYEAPSGELTYLLSTGEETDGKVTVFDAYFPKGAGVPWHIHLMDEELFIIISGKYTVGIGDEEFELGPGECAIAGIDVPRAFWATTDDARMIVVNAPGGPAEGFIRYMQSLQGPPDEEVFRRCREEFGIIFGKGDEEGALPG